VGAVGSLANAQGGGKCCYCEIGDQPTSQQGFFRTGCKIWLGDQKDCDTKEIVAQNTNYSAMDLKCDGGTMAVGYVGHWGSSSEMVGYLDDVIVPAMQKHHLSVNVENTACSAMNYPAAIVDFIKGLRLPPGQTLSVSGNQVESIGVWDHVLGKRINFMASISSIDEKVTYPSCKQYEGYNCVQQVQSGQPATCAEKDGSTKVLYCCGVTSDFTRANSQKFIWTTQDQCSAQ